MEWKAFLESDNKYHAYETNGNQRIRQLTFEGGEPFRDNDIWYYLERVDGKCCAVSYKVIREPGEVPRRDKSSREVLTCLIIV